MDHDQPVLASSHRSCRTLPSSQPRTSPRLLTYVKYECLCSDVIFVWGTHTMVNLNSNPKISKRSLPRIPDSNRFTSGKYLRHIKRDGKLYRGNCPGVICRGGQCPHPHDQTRRLSLAMLDKADRNPEDIIRYWSSRFRAGPTAAGPATLLGRRRQAHHYDKSLIVLYSARNVISRRSDQLLIR